MKLEPGGASTTVTVSGDTISAIDTETADTSRTITANEVQHIPVYERDPTSLIRLVPGVLADGAQQGGGGGFQAPGTQTGASSGGGGNLGHSSSIFATENGASANANGGQFDTNGYSIDGISTESAVWGGATVITPSEDSIGNIQISTNSYDAENGRFTGAVTEITSKSGTNNLHGSFFVQITRPGLNAYQRWNGPQSVQAFDATGQKLTPAERGLLRDEDRYNQLGGSIGGPIWKNRIFAFFAYEGQSQTIPATSTQWYPTAAFANLGTKQQHFRHLPSFQGSQCFRHSDRLSHLRQRRPRRRRKLQYDCGTGLEHRLAADHRSRQAGPYLCQQQQPGRWQRTFKRSGYHAVHDKQPYDKRFQTVQRAPRRKRNQQGSRCLCHLLGAFQLQQVEWRIGLSALPSRSDQRCLLGHLESHFFCDIPERSPCQRRRLALQRSRTATLRLPSACPRTSCLPQILPMAHSRLAAISLGALGVPAPSILNQWTYGYKDVATKVLGPQTMKFGFDFTRLYYLNDPIGAPNYTFYNLWDFLNDAPEQESGPFQATTGFPGGYRNDNRENMWGIFFQDDWKVRPNLTLSAGLRYNYFGPITDKDNNMGVVRFGSGADLLTGISIRTRIDGWNAQKLNFGPQIGFNWSPAYMKGKVVLARRLRPELQPAADIERRIPMISIRQGRAPFRESVRVLLTSIQISSTRFPPAPTSIFGYPKNPSAISTFNSAGLPASGGANIGALPTNLPTQYVYHYSLETEIDLGHQWVANVGYTGSSGQTSQLQLRLKRLRNTFWVRR